MIRLQFQILGIVILSACVCRHSIHTHALSSSSSSSSIRQVPIGRISSLDRSKVDTTLDSTFYRNPFFTTHTDQNYISQLTALYDELLPPTGGPYVVLDLMSSQVSHLPQVTVDRERERFERVDVHGMNHDELEANPDRTRTNGRILVRDLNTNPSLLGFCESESTTTTTSTSTSNTSGYYDAVLCNVGIQYLQEPEAVLAEVNRILKPRTGFAVVSFSNRFFYDKAITGWIERGMRERSKLVVDYFRAAGGFQDDPGAIRVVGGGTGALSQLLSVGGLGGDPFVAVIATKR